MKNMSFLYICMVTLLWITAK